MSMQNVFVARSSASQIALAVFALWLFATASAHAQQKANLPGMTYDSLKSLPDWSGLWGRGDAAGATFLEQPLPLKPELLARQLTLASINDEEPDPGRYCRPSEFTGYNGGFVESVEFLFTPGRVTLTNESGLIRRIYTDGSPLPGDPLPTNTGTSVGHWEGQTLIVETIGINPSAKFPVPRPGAVAVGQNVRITERITKTGPDTLEIEREVIAPDILTSPDKRKLVYRRVLKKRANEITLCADYDRAIDPVTGKQRFDMTPPADLPPPPAE